MGTDSPSRSSSRILFLDWLRGLAAITMLQGHTFDAFLRPQARSGSAFIFSQFFGGEAPAVFLFLAGVTYGLGMNRCEDLSPWQRIKTALKRARYLFLLAILFRIQTWAFFWPRSAWMDLFRVDVLNTMGATAMLLAIAALKKGIQRARLAAGAGLALAVLAPVISTFNTSAIPVALRSYFVPSPDAFSIFPWGAFLAFGLAMGSVIPLVEDAGWNRVMQWAALAGFGLLLGGQYFSNLPYSIYSKSEFWLNSPTLTACKLGIIFLLSAFAFLWTGYLSAGWSWVRQLGTTSLVVYWVHIELVYGRWFEAYRGRLEVWQCVAVSAALMAAMLGLSLAVTRSPWLRFVKALQSTPRPEPAPLKPALAYRELSRSKFSA
jgi:uncharacterized membrane protein